MATAWFHGALDEARWIAAEAVRLHDAGEVAWSDMAILFRRHAGIALVRDALERAGVPVEVASLGGLLDVPEVADLHAWLRLVGRPDDGAALMRVLLGARYHLGLGDLAPVAAQPVRRPPGEARTIPRPRRAGCSKASTSSKSCPGLSAEAARRLTAFRSTHRRLLEAAQGLSLVELCRRILDETGAWPEVEALGDAARLSARLNLYRFLDLAEGWSPLEGAPSLDAFLDYLDLLARGPRLRGARHRPGERRGRRGPAHRAPRQGPGVAGGLPPRPGQGHLPRRPAHARGPPHPSPVPALRAAASTPATCRPCPADADERKALVRAATRTRSGAPPMWP